MGRETLLEELIELIQSLDRPSLIHELSNFRAPFPIDLTDDFLNQQPLNRLRHLFLAIYLTALREKVDRSSGNK
jgi:uncharacterized protein with NAD-binding domain and iron-sulfur cluster